jgi:phenylalanyl-tRNA synthetase beta chain
MPNVTVNLKDMQKLVGKKLSMEEFREAVLFAKGEVDAVQGQEVTVDMKDTNRPDLLSAEGLAREIRSRLTKDRGVPKYRVRKSSVSLIVDKSVLPIRPKIAAAVVKNVKVTEDFLVQMIQLQEKVCMTFGRKRKEAAIGIYDWSKLKQPMHYTSYKPGEKKFIPLEWRAEMDLEEILSEHPKGKEYAHLLQGQKRYPVFEDSAGVVASMPPIINSQLTGKVSEKTKEVLVEVTGYSQETVNTALNVMVSALAERGFEVWSVKVRYPDKTIVTPDFTPKKVSVKMQDILEFSGLKLGKKQVVGLLEKARYSVKAKGGSLKCLYPAYRQDILHPVDVIEDAIISYGYNRIEPEPIRLAVVGGERAETRKSALVREICVGLGLQEILTYTMTSKRKQAELIGLDPEKEQFVELANPISENYTVFRKRLFPELLEFLAANRHVAYPQKIFEIGKKLELRPERETGVEEKNTLCIALCGKGAEFTVIKGVLEAVADSLGKKYSISECKEPAFERGKSASISLGGKQGLLGELKKKVLEDFGLEQPAAILELEI